MARKMLTQRQRQIHIWPERWYYRDRDRYTYGQKDGVTETETDTHIGRKMVSQRQR